MNSTETTVRKQVSVTEKYVSSDSDLQTILLGISEPRTPLVQALLFIQECLNGKRLARDAIAAAQAVPMEGADPELLILMLSGWAELSCRITRPAQAETLIHRARAVLSNNTRPEVRACVMLVESILADTTGDKTRRERILNDIIKLIPSSSPRRKFYVWELALFLAQQGRGVEADSDLKALAKACSDHFRQDRLLLVEFFNAFETGHTAQAIQLLPQIENSPQAPRDLVRDTFGGCQALLALMQIQGRDRKLVASTPMPPVHVPIWVRVVKSLLMRDTGEALRLARLDANRVLGSVFAGGFSSFNLIRAELAAGNWEAARRLLDMRRSRGNTHYMDALFLARAELLASDSKAAAHHFDEALKAVDFYQARGRLNFELEMACDLSPAHIVQLLRPEAPPTKRAKTSDLGLPPARRRDTVTPRPGDSIIGESPAIHNVRELIARFADIDAPVLITGETGTGKELVARALFESSKRKGLPFVAVNCGSIAETILESELFGHERGAFTGADRATKGLFEEAGNGTIFLDEIGEIPPHLQRALLRVLEIGEIRAVGSARTRKIKCRILAATNAELVMLAEEGQFRKDLLFRLQRLCIHIPPLRERRDDVLLLARHFLDVDRRPGVHATLSEDVVSRIRAYRWPGNVRELKNVIERMRLMHSDKLAYSLSDLDLKFQAVPLSADPGKADAPPVRPVPNAPPSAPASNSGTELSGPAPDTPTGTAALPPPSALSESEQLRGGSSPLRRVDRIRELFARHGKMTRNELIRILGVSPNTATKDLKALCEEGLIERVEPSTSTRSHYFVLKEKTKPASSNGTDGNAGGQL